MAGWMHFPVRLVDGGWPNWLLARLRRFVRIDARAALEDRADAGTFRKTMSLIQVGDTIKITGANRHPEIDGLLIDNVELAGKTIVDIGASDGSTSLDLIGRLSDFGAYVISDRYLTAQVLTTGRRSFVYDETGSCTLVAGPRFVAWPHLSRVVSALYAPLLRPASRRRAERRELLLLNPDVRALIERDERVSYRTHDVFEPWPEPKPDAIKVANVLRRLYFSDTDIGRGLDALHESLPTGGHLLIVDNHRDPTIPRPRGGLYRRTAEGFELVASTEYLPEINDLVLGPRRSAHDASSSDIAR